MASESIAVKCTIPILKITSVCAWPCLCKPVALWGLCRSAWRLQCVGAGAPQVCSCLTVGWRKRERGGCGEPGTINAMMVKLAAYKNPNYSLLPHLLPHQKVDTVEMTPPEPHLFDGHLHAL